MGKSTKLFAVLLLAFPVCGLASILAYDDAADSAYLTGAPYNGINGGFGFAAWQENGFPFGGNPALQSYVGSSVNNDPAGPPLPDIDTAGRAWGNNAQPTGNTFLARRNLLTDLPVGGTYSISFDTGDVDGQETLSWGKNNFAMCQFYFNGADANYKFVDLLSSTTIDTGILQTFGGLRLTLTRDSASTYSFQAVRLTDSLTFIAGPYTYDTTNIPGIRTINLSNNDGGNGLGHSMYLNAIEATDVVPEPAALSLAALAILGLRRRHFRGFIS